MLSNRIPMFPASCISKLAIVIVEHPRKNKLWPGPPRTIKFATVILCYRRHTSNDITCKPFMIQHRTNHSVQTPKRDRLKSFWGTHFLMRMSAVMSAKSEGETVWQNKDVLTKIEMLSSVPQVYDPICGPSREQRNPLWEQLHPRRLEVKSITYWSCKLFKILRVFATLFEGAVSFVEGFVWFTKRWTELRWFTNIRERSSNVEVECSIKSNIRIMNLRKFEHEHSWISGRLFEFYSKNVRLR